jgi:hypothetical protein
MVLNKIGKEVVISILVILGHKVIVPDNGAKDIKVGTLRNIEKTSGIKMR